MAQEKIIIKFEPSGDKRLVSAINALRDAQISLETKTKKVKKTFTDLNPKMLQIHSSLKLQGKSWTALGVSVKIGTAALKGNKNAISMVNARLQALGITQAQVNKGALLGVRNNRLLANSFATLRSQLLLVSFGAMLIERAFVSLVKAHGRQEAANEKLRVGLGNVQGTTEGVTQRLVDYSAALQQTTAFGDEMITTGMVQFTTFGLNEKAMKSLTPQVLNVARAIQTVSGTMPDLNSLFIAFGKATTTGIGTLTRYGVVLTETERAQLSSMDANESAVKIAEILERQYGGLADAYAKTTAGMLEAAALARGDAAEALGEVLAPAVLAVSKGLKAMFEALTVERIRAYTTAIGLAAAGTILYKGIMLGTTGILKKAAAAQVLLNKAIRKNPFLLIASVAAVATGALLDYFGVFDDGNKTLTDAEKKLKKFNAALEEDIRLRKEWKEVQRGSVDALQKRLDLLNATSLVEKMLIELGHDASILELELISKIAGKIKAIKEEEEHKKKIIELDKKIADGEKAVAEAEKKRNLQKINKELKDLKEEKKELEQQVKDEIEAQKELDAIDKKLIETLKAMDAANNRLMVTSLEQNALLDSTITLTEKIAINDEKWAQAQAKVTAAQDAFDIVGYEAAQAELNEVKKESISLKLQELDQETQGLILAQNRAVLDRSKSKIDAEQEIINIKRNMLDEKYYGILHSDTAPAAERLSYKQLVLELDEEQNELDEKKIALKQALIDVQINGAAQVVASTETAIGAIQANWNAVDSKNKKEEIAEAKKIKNKRTREAALDKIEEKYAAKALDRAKKLKGWKLATAISNVALGITQTWRDDSMPPWAKVAMTIAQAAAGAAQIATISGSEFAQGGLVGGRRHSQGGTMIEAEQGEFVMSRSAVDSVGLENLNRMNEGGGGGAITVNVSGNVMSQDYVEGELANQIKDAIRRGEDFGIS